MASILIIDDDDLLREILVTTLTHAGHTVYQAPDGRQGCDLFHASPTDLVITDIIMPGQEGIETMLKLRRMRPGLPIIAMSGGLTHSEFYLDMAAKLGATRILAKPFTPAELQTLIAAVLANNSPPRAAASAAPPA